MDTYAHAPDFGEQPVPHISAEALEIEQRDGKPYVVTSPLPEYILVSSELWAEVSLEPDAGDDNWLWLETIQHADEDRDNDGYRLHVEASNVSATFSLVSEDADGTRLLQLQSWGEH